MLNNDVENSILIHELQLGEKLNECIHNERRSDFSLMLAMLAEDVRAQSQFVVPKTEDEEVVHSNQKLRKQFMLANEQPLSLKHLDDIQDFNQATLVQSHGLTELRLKEALNPKTIAFRNDSKHIPQDVLNNTSLYCQKQHQNKNEKMDQRLDFDAKGWLNAVQSTIVKSQLININC